MREPKNTITPEDVEWEMDWSQLKPDGTRMYPNKPDKETIFEEKDALAHLLINDVVFLNSFWWEKEWPEEVQKAISVAVNCNDIFAWGCADAEPLPYEQIEPLYRLFQRDHIWGPVVWCMIQRKELPQGPVAKDMAKAGWDLDALASEHGLLKNFYDGYSLIQAQLKYRAYSEWALANGKTPLEFASGWWDGWKEYTEANPGWNDEKWKAEEAAELEQWEIQEGWSPSQAESSR